ncbi:zinc-ribbon domain-containing protein [Anaerocolumna xylanovorans]|uniref:Zinc-ribbon domain-containing protein n=1 Tax=Anaerocolumna xylanovorans DSM 12503 TaxID=1121345 RepID=A0A1M7Y7I0_9FIRM|nr:zinc-ribbon domain-containing protein [Anaerocolumna xylanovorans]SHO48592.1 zinc-ribbon domain-containing protein [Anaerocolumna xylanovorans DSM 12503]
MFCRNCGSAVQDTSKFCTKCGYRIERDSQPEDQNNVQPVEGTENAEQPEAYDPAAAAYNPAAEAYDPAGEAYDPAAAAYDSAAAGYNSAAAGYNSAANQGISSEVLPGKRKGIKFRGKKAIIIVAAAVVLLLIGGVANAAAIQNFAISTFSSPEKYYQYVEAKSMEDTFSVVASLYDSNVRESFHWYDRSASGEINLELGEKGQDALNMLGTQGIDVSWLKKAGISFDASVKDNLLNTNMKLTVNGDKLISGDATLDLEKEIAYLQLPELTEKYLGMKLSDMDELFKSLDMMKKMYDSCPDKDEVNKLLNKYFSLAMSYVDDVKKSSATLSEEGITQKLTVLEIKIDGDTIRDMTEAILKTMQDDKELEDIIKKLDSVYEDMNSEYGDSEDLYESFQDGIKDSLENIDELSAYEGLQNMTVWVDSKGEIKGRSIEFDDGKIEVLMPEKGKNFGFEASVKYEDNTYSLSGSGKRSGSKIDGDFEATYNGDGLIDINVKDFDAENMRDGYVNGTFTVKPSSQISKVFSMADTYDISSYIKDMALKMDVSMKKDSASTKLSLLENNKLWGILMISANTGSGKKINLPDDSKVVFTDDEYDVSGWTDTFDWNGFLDKLSNTDLPSEWIDELRNINMDDVLPYYWY